MQTKDILKDLRKSKGFSTMQEFCNASNISFSTYQNYESGKRLPTAEFLMQIADFYGVTTDYLLGREPAQPEPNPFENLKLTKEQEEDANEKYKMLTPQDKAIVASIIKAFAEAHRQEQSLEIVQTTTVGNMQDLRAKRPPDSDDSEEDSGKYA